MPDFTVTLTDTELGDEGYHHEDDCDHSNCMEADDNIDLYIVALEEMHAALHPEVSSIDRCLQAPCNRLPRLPKPPQSGRYVASGPSAHLYMGPVR